MCKIIFFILTVRSRPVRPTLTIHYSFTFFHSRLKTYIFEIIPVMDFWYLLAAFAGRLLDIIVRLFCYVQHYKLAAFSAAMLLVGSPDP